MRPGGRLVIGELGKWSTCAAGRRLHVNSRRGRNESTPISVEKLALALPKSSWRTIHWRDGTNEILSSRSACVRVRSAHDRNAARKTVPEEWLLIEWPPDEAAPTK